MQEAAAEPVEAPPPPFNPTEFAKTLPGITAPFGFFDPAGFCSSDGASNEQVSEGKVRFYREVELKHGRVAMLAALGFPVAEQFHPLFATDDAPSFSAFQQTPLQTFWPAVVLVIAIPEIFSVFTFEGGTQRRTARRTSTRSGRSRRTTRPATSASTHWGSSPRRRRSSRRCRPKSSTTAASP